MQSAAIPPDEARRLARLIDCRVLDTPPDPRFDRLVELAADHFEVPIALVSLIDANRQWFKARRGMDASETPREIAFCAHSILQPDDVLVVEDATRDPRFADNPLVQGNPRIRFYAGAPIRMEDGQPIGTLCLIDRRPRRLDSNERRFLANLAATAASMLELHRHNAVLMDAAVRDPLTGLANRRSFDVVLGQAADKAMAGLPFGLICIDLDLFKQVNDTLGHEAGDALLREVARRLSGAIRATDVVARLGGDEFAVVVGGPLDLAGARTVAQNILRALAPAMEINGQVVPIRASLGLAVAPVHGTNPGTLMSAADRALYEAKHAGGQGVVLAQHGPSRPAATPTIERDLRRAIDAGTLHLEWQPYFAAQDGAVVGYEALARWNRPGHGPISPAEFIPVAERGGLIADLDAWVLRHACTAAARWALPLSVSVNISASWFSDGDLLELVHATLEQTGLNPSRLILELTETMLVDNPDAARARLAALRGLGVRAALDDFGIGYSALSYLSSFNFDKVKLDRSLVEGVGYNTRAEMVCRAVLDLGRALGVTVCAEGVETAEQLRFLRDAGCDLIQGFLLGRPVAVPAPESARISAAFSRINQKS